MAKFRIFSFFIEKLSHIQMQTVRFTPVPNIHDAFLVLNMKESQMKGKKEKERHKRAPWHPWNILSIQPFSVDNYSLLRCHCCLVKAIQTQCKLQCVKCA